MSNMDEPMDAVEQVLAGGISRRDMIKASVVAGALVWSAPLLLSGKSFAVGENPNCPCNGTVVRINIPASFNLNAANCGKVNCLAERTPALAVACAERESDIVCQIMADNLITFEDTDPGGDPAKGTIKLDPKLTVVAVSVRVTFQGGGNTHVCYFTDCDNLSISQTAPPQNTNTAGMDAPPVPGNNRIWVPDAQTIRIELAPGGVEKISEVDLLLCVSSLVSGC